MKKLLITVIALLVTGCSITPQTNAPTAVYDFGLQYADNRTRQAQLKSASLLVAEVASPIWLDNPAIHYRLAYHNPAQFYSYANSRWAAAPAALLTRQISNRIMQTTDYKVARGIEGVQADYALHIVLEDFSQVFDSIDKSYAVILLNVSLIERRTRKLVAQRNFSMRKETPTADAVGAVNALVEVSNHLNNNLIDWLTDEIAEKK
ncbi:MAG: ABC-type transport auxiliary lipoprotein family protein [Nitrosomonas sp.]|nr:ABC-type transport auxiliary lipoprotein family protein [Nitrosomonas sp.]MDP1950928.1 ABC-type transport auxiliary lipoprotein family protein [Nitrosomonas sp.]